MPSVDLHHVVEGSGPPMLLLHGFPETHICWDAVVERLGSEFTLVRPDLRGYGDSPKPEGDDSKRAMAADVLDLMRRLGHERFAVAGHDRACWSPSASPSSTPTRSATWRSSTTSRVVEMWESTPPTRPCSFRRLSHLIWSVSSSRSNRSATGGRGRPMASASSAW
jgi:haloacetate dehalogenase